MIFIRRKTIFNILFCLILLIGFIGMRNELKNNKTIATAALPVKNKTIIIDPGHGTPDERGFK